MKIIYEILAIGFLSAVLGEKIPDDEWHSWKKFYGKSYEDNEEHVRYAIWKENSKMIARHNEGQHSYSLTMNHLGDLTRREFKQMVNGFQGKVLSATKGKSGKGSTYLPPSNVALPENVDWRKEGYVTPVKNQGQCGSCWAFSTTGSLEGQHFKKTGKLVSLSEQNLVDCSRSYGNNGCEGGLMDNAFKYIKDNNGLDTEESYPYKAEDGKCVFNSSDIGATDTGFVDVTAGSEKDLKMASATVGPISVAIDAGHMSFQFYHKGVYDNEDCSSTQLDHGVLVVGYGVYKSTFGEPKKYWLVKNSWGPGWGLEGYVMMSRNKNNQCGIASAASYPLV